MDRFSNEEGSTSGSSVLAFQRFWLIVTILPLFGEPVTCFAGHSVVAL